MLINEALRDFLRDQHSCNPAGHFTFTSHTTPHRYLAGDTTYHLYPYIDIRRITSASVQCLLYANMSDPPPAKKPSGLSLYGDLIAPKEGGVISAGPVKYDMKAKAPEPEAQKKKNGRVAFHSLHYRPSSSLGVQAAYQFTPAIKRPVQKKGKSKPSSSFGVKPSVGGVAGTAAAVAQGTSLPDKQISSGAPQQPPVGRGLTYQDIVDNVDEDEDEELYMNHKPKWQGRGGKKHKNKKNRRQEEEDEVDWDAIYDPAKPSNLARYQGSTEQDAERAEWTHFLHWHRDKANKHAKVQKTKPRNSRFTLMCGEAIPNLSQTCSLPLRTSTLRHLHSTRHRLRSTTPWMWTTTSITRHQPDFHRNSTMAQRTKFRRQLSIYTLLATTLTCSAYA